MKRKLIVATVGIAAAAALAFVGAVWAQQPAGNPVPARPAAGPNTRIALLNLTYVVNYYEKYKAWKEEIKTQAQPFEDRIKKANATMEALRKEATAATPPSEARRQEIEKLMKACQRDAEDANLEAKGKFLKQEQDEYVLLYKEVQTAAGAYARAHNFDLVLQYNEPLKQEDYWSAANIERKIGAGALIPLYYSNGMEISVDVLGMLNSAYKGPAAGAPTTPGATPTP